MSVLIRQVSLVQHDAVVVEEERRLGLGQADGVEIVFRIRAELGEHKLDLAKSAAYQNEVRKRVVFAMIKCSFYFLSQHVFKTVINTGFKT